MSEPLLKTVDAPMGLVSNGAKEIALAPFVRRQMIVRVGGTMPLITNRFSERAMEKIAKGQSGAAKEKKDARNPEQEFRDACHFIDADAWRCGYPGTGIKKALVHAGGRFAEEVMTFLRGALQIPVRLVEIHAPPPEMGRDPVLLNNGKGPWSIAYRPYFQPWEMEVPILYSPNLISDERLLNLFNVAGFAIGVGCWRPETNGPYGTFDVRDARVENL